MTETTETDLTDGRALLRRMAVLVPRLAEAAAKRANGDRQARLDQALQILETDYATQPETGAAETDPLAGLAEVYGLDSLDLDILLLAAAADLDATFSITFGLLRGGTAPARITVGLILELCGLSSMSSAGFARLGPAGPLRRHSLIEVAADSPWLAREVSIPDRVVAHLLGVDEPENNVTQLMITPIPLALQGTEVLSRAVAAGVPLAWVRGPLGTAGVSLAAAAFRALDLHCLCIDVDRMPAGAPVRDVLKSATREAALRGCGLIVAGADRLGESGNAGAFGILQDAAVPVIAVGTRHWDRNWLPDYPLTADAPAVTSADRETAWQLAGGASLPKDGLEGLRLTPEMIADTARYSQLLATANDEPLTGSLVRQAARRVGGSTSSNLVAARAAIDPAAGEGFDALVLPEHIMASLQRLVAWSKGRNDRNVGSSMAQVAGMGAGIAALFTGSPGTGKTLAAHVIADVLGLDLFQVDLSSIVDKYIGETEKNLERIFHEAESLNVVLFFDEADALFGKRSDVKDAHDRYANQEVAYLLQRMELFDGITILATNLRGNLDVAFSRRMSFIVHFPDPDEPTRRRLWEAHLNKLGAFDPHDPINLDRLAGSVELAGGDIKNIVQACAYDAMAEHTLPGMRHVLAATISEYQKLGRRLPAHGFAWL